MPNDLNRTTEHIQAAARIIYDIMAKPGVEDYQNGRVAPPFDASEADRIGYYDLAFEAACELKVQGLLP